MSKFKWWRHRWNRPVYEHESNEWREAVSHIKGYLQNSIRSAGTLRNTRHGRETLATIVGDSLRSLGERGYISDFTMNHRDIDQHNHRFNITVEPTSYYTHADLVMEIAINEQV